MGISPNGRERAPAQTALCGREGCVSSVNARPGPCSRPWASLGAGSPGSSLEPMGEGVGEGICHFGSRIAQLSEGSVWPLWCPS